MSNAAPAVATNKRSEPLRLTRVGYWQELEELTKKGSLPPEIGMLLKGLISAHFKKAIPPGADTRTIMLAKEYLSGGIVMIDSPIESPYDVIVFRPDSGNEERLRTFFCLVPK